MHYEEAVEGLGVLYLEHPRWFRTPNPLADNLLH